MSYQINSENRCSVQNFKPKQCIFKLYIWNMPLDFDEKILRDLFLYFGNPLEIYKSDGWAFVSYGTRREAEFAIHELNNMPPYFLKVQFAFIPKEKERIHDEMSQNYILNAILDSEPRHYTRLSYNCVRNVGIGRGHGFDLPFPITPRHRPGEFEEMVFSDHDDKEGGNMHHYLHPQSTGFLLPPVSGIKIREYTEQQHKKIKQNLEILCAKVTGDFLQSTENSIKPCLAGNCLHCNKLTMQFCQRCRGSYCSRECQVDDWSNHKSKCVPIVMPTVTSASDVNSDKSVSFDHGYKFSKCFVQEPKYEARDKRQFGSKSSFNGRNSYNVDKSNSTSYRQKHNSEDIEKTKSGFGTNKNYSTYGSFKYSGNKSSINERLKIRMSTSSEDSTVDRSKNVSELKGSLPLYDLPSKEVINSDILTSSGDSITKSCNLEETDVLEIGKLTNDVFKKAKVVVVIGQFQCWVQLEDSITKLQEVMYALNNGSLGSVMTSVKEGIICAALYEGLWYRGKVTSVEPKLKVLYIDFGNEECCTLDQLRSVPDAVKNISPLAVKIQLAKGFSKKYETLTDDQVLYIKSVGVEADAILVHVEGEKYPEKSSINKNSSEKFSPLHQPIQNANDSPIPAVLNLKVGMMGVCQFQHELNSDDFGVSIVFNKVKDDYMRLSTSLINMTKTSSSVDFKPNVGENVIALVQDGRKFWVRAKILAIDESGYRVNLYDFGYVTTSKTIQKLPEDLKSIPEFGSRCTFTNYIIPKNESWCKEEVMLSFTVVAVDELLGTICCNLKSDEREVGTIILKEWIPSIIDYNTVLLSNDDKVVLSIFFSVNCLYIRPVENYFKEKFSKLEQDLSQHCLSAPDVDIMPEKNEIVASKYLDDGKYYRARILQADNDSVKVMYVDFGNVQSVNKSRLKLLPPELRDIPALAVKVSLKNINEKLIMDNAYSFFASLIDKEIEMKVSISDSMKNGIELILPDGRILNNEVNKLAYPKLHEKIQEKSKENILRENNIKYAELPVGKTVQLLVLHKIDSTLLMGCEADEVAMTLIFGTISEEIRKYCESTIEKSYEPKLNELCFAKFEDGSWYRGICVDNDTSTNKDNILFFDFGNTSHIEKTNIRKMTEEFLKLPALGLLCKLNNIKEVQKKQVDSLIEVNKMYEALVISSDSAGSYVIEFPHVTRAIN